MKLKFAHILVGVLCLVFCSVQTGWARDDDSIKQVSKATRVLKEIMATDRGVPRRIFAGARCIAVFPQVLKGGFIVGGRYGRGVASCRIGDARSNAWSAPAFLRMTGGSFGLLIGGQATDLVLLFMNEKGLDRLVSSKFEIGGDASAAAGPVGREVGASSDMTLGAQILSYSRSRGLFAGLEIKGAVVSQDKENMDAAYGRGADPRVVLTSRKPAPLLLRMFPETLARYSGKPVNIPVNNPRRRPPSTSLDRYPPQRIPQ